MIKNLPKQVTLFEVGPRDGFQFEDHVIPTDLKIDIIQGLVDAGLKHIQVASFVRPDRVPQMADAEQVVKRLPPAADVVFSGLVLNAEGVTRARTAGLTHVEVSISASGSHSLKNAGMSRQQAERQAGEMIRLAQSLDLTVRAGIQCAFGCVYEGRIPEQRIVRIVRGFVSRGVNELALSDTTGMADPVSVWQLLQLVLPACEGIPVVLHFHDTRGLGLANVLAALQSGVTRFDTALAGMGGCPFVPGAAGNIATEDTAHLLQCMGIHTGVDIARVASCSLKLEAFLAKRFPGKMYRLLP